MQLIWGGRDTLTIRIIKMWEKISSFTFLHVLMMYLDAPPASFEGVHS